MTKTQLQEYFGTNGSQIAAKLGYTHRNWWYGLPEELKPLQSKNIIMRMTVAGLKVPKGWK